MLDRGKAGFACTDAVVDFEWTADTPEHRANEYAADLLLPEFMFIPRAKNMETTFATVQALAREFTSSLTATAIRLIEFGSFPAMLIFSDSGWRKWFRRGPDIPEILWPREQPKRDTVASDLMQGRHNVRTPLEIYADSWIGHRDAHRYGVVEDSIKVGPSQVLTLIWWKDERPLLALEEED